MWRRLASRLGRGVRRRLLRFTSIGRLPGERSTIPVANSAVPTSEVAQMRLDPIAEALRSSSYAPPVPALTTLRRVIVHAGSHLILTRGRRVVAESSIQGTAVSDVPLRQISRPAAGRVEGTCAVFRSRWNNHYHTLVDNMPRLWLLHHEPAAREQEIQLLVGGELSPVERWFVPRLAPPNVRVRSLPMERSFLVDRLIVPSFLSRNFAGYLPPAYLEWLLERVAPPRRSRRDARIVISRRRTTAGLGRYFENEGEVLAALEPLGFRRYVLDAVPPDEQVALFHDAEVIVGAHGAGLTNMMFARQAAVVELFAASFVTPFYYFLSKACGHAYRYLYGTGNDRNASVTVDVPLLLRTLGEMGIH